LLSTFSGIFWDGEFPNRGVVVVCRMAVSVKIGQRPTVFDFCVWYYEYIIPFSMFDLVSVCPWTYFSFSILTVEFFRNPLDPQASGQEQKTKTHLCLFTLASHIKIAHHCLPQEYVSKLTFSIVILTLELKSICPRTSFPRSFA
jgi:hypothetical protein